MEGLSLSLVTATGGVGQVFAIICFKERGYKREAILFFYSSDEFIPGNKPLSYFDFLSSSFIVLQYS